MKDEVLTKHTHSEIGEASIFNEQHYLYDNETVKQCL